MQLEEKILKLYEYICLNYVYDDNVLFFFRKDLSDPNNIKYIAQISGPVIRPAFVDSFSYVNVKVYGKATSTGVSEGGQAFWYAYET